MEIVSILLFSLLVVHVWTVPENSITKGFSFKNGINAIKRWSIKVKCAIVNRIQKLLLRIQLMLLCKNEVSTTQTKVSIVKTTGPAQDQQPNEKKVLHNEQSSMPKGFEDKELVPPEGFSNYNLQPITGSFVEFLYKNLQISDHDKINIAVSPLSLEVVLAGVGMGAGSYTQEEIFRVLDVKEETIESLYSTKISNLELEKQTSLKLVTKVYLEQSFLPINENFKNQLEEILKTEIEPAHFVEDSFLEMKKINMYVAEKTEGYIQDAVQNEDVRPDTDVLLLNILYFKGEWEIPFSKKESFNGDFNLPSHIVQATFMTRAAAPSYYKAVPEGKYSMLELPYLQTSESELFSMIIILPDDVYGLSEVEKHLTNDVNWIADFDLYSITDLAMVKPTIPKFKIDINIDLKSSLIKMGVVIMFEDSADFHKITDQKKLKIATIRQRVYIEVNEMGTTAVAATSASSAPVKGMFDLRKINFVANHPFAFALIQRDTKTVLFMGHVIQPEFENQLKSTQEETEIETPTTDEGKQFLEEMLEFERKMGLRT